MTVMTRVGRSTSVTFAASPSDLTVPASPAVASPPAVRTTRGKSDHAGCSPSVSSRHRLFSAVSASSAMRAAPAPSRHFSHNSSIPAQTSTGMPAVDR